MPTATTRRKKQPSTARRRPTAPANLTQIAREIAGEVAAARGTRRAPQTTLRQLLTRCGYRQRNTQTVRRIAAALDAVGVQCLPPPLGVDDLDAPLRLTAAPPRKTIENSAPKTAPLNGYKNGHKNGHKNGSRNGRAPRRPRFKSLEAMLSHARLATVLVAFNDGHGSGFVIDKSGLVLTARHVVDSAEAVCLRFEDGREMEASVVFSDAALDYAFIQGEPCEGFLPLYDDVKLAVGQTIYAVGAPLQADLAGSVTRGIISGLDRVIGGVSYIQTDATIHTGHSGGPLLTEQGDVIGINLWGRSEAGIRFALPVSYALEALAVLRPQIKDLYARLYCSDCGFLNGAESWILCESWLCCGHCGSILGDFKARGAQGQNPTATQEDALLSDDACESATQAAQGWPRQPSPRQTSSPRQASPRQTPRQEAQS